MSRRKPSELKINLVDADREWIERLTAVFGEKAAGHLHFKDGFVTVATYESELVGIISVYWRNLPDPLAAYHEGYIDIIESHRDYRRCGIASQLIQRAIELSSAHGAFQIRAWSSEDKLEAIPMWRKLEFGLVPTAVEQEKLEIRGFYAVKVLG